MKLKTHHISNLLKYFFVSILLACGTVASGQLVANFAAAETEGCAPILVHFSDLSSGNPGQWKWDLGNGTISYLQNPSVTYFNPGKYSVKLIVRKGNNTDSVIKETYITVHAAPVADFISAATTGCTPFNTAFNDKSVPVNGSITKWEWDLGDGKLSNEPNPVYTYAGIGDFNITLKVTNSNGCTASARKAAFIKTNGVNPSFSIADSSTCSKATAFFTDNTSGNGTMQCKWFFGDGTTSSLQHPGHEYADGGSYTVKLITENDKGCRDSVTKKILLAPIVSAVFTSDKLSSCTAPAAISYASHHADGNNYLWDFGDSSTSTLPDPMHTYKDTGLYNVKLIVANANGCVDSVRRNGFIKVGKQNLVFSNLPDSSCTGFTKKFIADQVSGDNVISYRWNFGDGSTSTSVSPTHTFYNTGYYDISLITEAESGCRDTLLFPKGIRTDTKPAANFKANFFESCGNTEISFTDLSTGGANHWNWDFGDGDKEQLQNVKHIFRDTGYMNVILVAYKGGCGDTAKFKKYIYVKPAIGCFRATLECAHPYTIKLYNCSIGADKYNWDFGDGDTSSLFQPVHTYKDTGTYKVTLRVINYSTGCAYTTVKTIKILDVTPSFYSSERIVCSNQEITLHSTSGKDVYRNIWDFGDGEKISSGKDTVTHRYKKPGVYTVRLVTSDFINCRDTLDKNAYIKVTGPSAGFTPESLITGVNYPLAFRDSTKHDDDAEIQSWQWDFGDGSIKKMQSPPFNYAYTKPGLYYVNLKTTDSRGCTDSFTYPMPIAVTKMQLKFDADETIVCPNTSIHFTAQPQNPLLQYNWYFGDGASSVSSNPAYKYAQQGSYDVKLVVTDQYGNTDSVIKQAYITVVAPAVSFNMTDSFRSCPPLNVKFTEQSENAVSSIWDFGDGSFTANKNPSHFYTLPGTYIAKLTVTGVGGCSQQFERNITIKGPNGTLEYDSAKLCKPFDAVLTVKAVNAVAYTWDFNDGNTAVNTDTVMRHTYKDAGNYRPKVILADENGCKVPIAGTKELKAISVDAKFTLSAKPVCDSNTVRFSNASVLVNDDVKYYHWDFGDGSTSNNVQPVHNYIKEGRYAPALTVQTIEGCTSSFTTDEYFTISLSPDVVISTSPNGCTPLTMQVNTQLGQAGANGVQWNWSFGNGNISTVQNPPQQLYQQPGIYNVQLTATSNNGCVKNISKQVEAYATPVVRTGRDTAVCRGTTVSLLATGATKYYWTPVNGLTANNLPGIVAKPDSTTAYIVKGSTANGCSAFDTVLISVKQKFVLNYNREESICKGQSKKLLANGADVYAWYPSKGLSGANLATPLAQPDSTTNYRVIGSDAGGCFKDTGYVLVNVYPVPYVDAGEDKTITAGNSIELIPRISEDVIEANWSPTSGIFRNSANGITAKPDQTTEYTLEVKNGAGCRARDKVQVFVLCNGSNVFIPNTFSPNGDGVNEIFYLRGKGLFKIRSLRIFSRWGQEVFQKTDFNANDPNSGWDGTFKGTKLQSDVFVYIAEITCVNNSVITYKGNVALVR